MKNDTLSKYLIIALIIVVMIWGGMTLLIYVTYGNTVEKSGQIGDAFGAVNALFSAFAFAFLIYTALMQRKELELQRKELKLTRKELKKSAESQKELAKINNEMLRIQKMQHEQINGSRLEFVDKKQGQNNEINFEFRVENFDMMYIGYKLENRIINLKKVHVEVKGKPNAYSKREKESIVWFSMTSSKNFSEWDSNLIIIFKNSYGIKMYQEFKMIKGQIDLDRPVENKGKYVTDPQS